MTDGRCKQIFAQKRTKSGGVWHKKETTPGWRIEDVNKFFETSVEWHGWLVLKWNSIPGLIATKTRGASSKKIIKRGSWRKISDTTSVWFHFFRGWIGFTERCFRYMHSSNNARGVSQSIKASVINSWPLQYSIPTSIEYRCHRKSSSYQQMTARILDTDVYRI